MRIRAAICSRFGVAWHHYGSLTVREHRVLVEAIAAEVEERAQLHEQLGSPQPTAAAGIRRERVC